MIKTFQVHSPSRRALNTISMKVILQLYKQDKYNTRELPRIFREREHSPSKKRKTDASVTNPQSSSLVERLFILQPLMHLQFLFSSFAYAKSTKSLSIVELLWEFNSERERQVFPYAIKLCLIALQNRKPLINIRIIGRITKISHRESGDKHLCTDHIWSS